MSPMVRMAKMMLVRARLFHSFHTKYPIPVPPMSISAATMATQALPIEILRREILPGGGGLRASYVVAPSEGDGLLLEVDEAYALKPGGEALSGIVKVVFRQGAETRGSYTLHRRFERLD